MTEDDLELLKKRVDEVVELTLTDGRRMLARVLIVYDEGETPDLFCLEVEPTPSGYVQKGANGHSILLTEVERVTVPPDEVSAG